MENTGTVCTHVADRSLSHGRGQPQENLLLGRMGEGSGYQRQCYNCGKYWHLANECPSKYKVATKADKNEERKLIIYFIFTNMLFFSNCSTYTNLIK